MEKENVPPGLAYGVVGKKFSDQGERKTTLLVKKMKEKLIQERRKETRPKIKKMTKYPTIARKKKEKGRSTTTSEYGPIEF